MCYKAHLQILQQHTNESLDEDLSELLDNLSQQVSETPKTADEVIRNAHLGTLLLNRDVLLLPDIQDMFAQHAQHCDTEINRVAQLAQQVTSRQLLSQLKVNLKHHITYECKAKKFGTLVYRPETDMGRVLTKHLWKHRAAQKHQPKHETRQQQTDRETVQRLLDSINDKVHDQIKKHLAADDFDHRNIDFEELISTSDDMLWETIWLLTRSVSERRGSSKINDTTSKACHGIFCPPGRNISSPLDKIGQNISDIA